MKVTVEETFDFSGPEYRRLYSEGKGTAFQAPMWLDMLHRRLGPSLGAKQRTVTFRNEADDSLLAVLPLVMQRSSGVMMIQPADFGISDYNTIVCDEERFEQIAASPAVLKALRETLRGGDLLMFRKVRADGFDIQRLFMGARESRGENSAYAFDIGDDFDHWRLKVMNRNFTKNLGRLHRQTEAAYGPYLHKAITDEQEIRAVFDFLREARQDRYSENLLDRHEYFDLYRDYAVAAAASGEAVLYVSYLAGEPVAALFGLAGDGEFHATLLASDIKKHQKISAGMQILYRVAQLRHQDGHRVMDLCLGDPGYKTHFRPTETTMRNITVALSLKGAAVAAIYHHAKPLKNFLRKGVANVR